MSNALLLRLFTSEFFNSWIAVSYLFRYPDNVGIQHYLCSELKKFPISEIEFFLPQLMHLLISRPTESVALECFLVEMCEKSTHMAIMSHWYLQAYLSDLSATPSSPSFQLCKRVLNKCQAIVFSDGQPTFDNDLVDATASLNLGMSTHKVKENVIPALVGIGAILAGIGQPAMTRPAGDIAIAQGRRNRTMSITSDAAVLARRNTLDASGSPVEHNNAPRTSGPASVPSSNTGTISTVTDHPRFHDPSCHFQSVSQPDLPLAKRRAVLQHHFTSSPSLEDLHRGKAFSMSRYLKSAHQKLNRRIRPTSVISNRSSSIASSGFDPSVTSMGQSSVPTNSEPLSPALSQCSASSSEDLVSPDHRTKHPTTLSHTSTPSDANQVTDAPHPLSEHSVSDEHDSDEEEYSTLSQLSREHRRTLLRSNYFRSEMQFLLALVDIATRLVIVPKQARTSALNAELTLLNHNLPAEVCIPLWCPATAHKPHHHRVVRISPSDAVVLNSAERAPYLLMIEVLDDELSFDDDYSSALHRMRRMMKRSSSRKQKGKALTGTSPSPESAAGSPVVASQEASEADASADNHHTPESSPQKDDSVAAGTSSSEGEDEHLPQKGRQSELSVSQSPQIQRSDSRFADDYAERMRTAAIMLAQLQQNSTVSPGSGIGATASAKTRQDTEQIRQRVIKEMMALEEKRMMVMKQDENNQQDTASIHSTPDDILRDEQLVAWVVNKEDPSAAVFSEDWKVKKARIRASSPYGHLPNWRLLSVIVKQGADLRQEQFAVQLIREMQRIWEDTGVDVWVKYFRILVTSDSAGLVETLRNTISIHSIKKDAYTRGWNTKGSVFTLYDYFVRHFGRPNTDSFIKAQDAFMRSLAGYSIACYILQIKDRHNGNLLIDDAGHLIHIDFGFMLSNSPGSVGFELAPFKLPQEYIDILGGIHSEKFAEYKALMKAGFLAVRKHSENIILLVEMMLKDSKMACFQNGDLTLQQLRDRFQLHLTEPQTEEFVDKLIMSSCCNVFTRLYDTFQYYSQGIL